MYEECFTDVLSSRNIYILEEQQNTSAIDHFDIAIALSLCNMSLSFFNLS